jgi:hypothetical protein
LETGAHPVLPRFGTRPSAEEAGLRPVRWHRRHRVIRLFFFLTIAIVALLAWLTNIEEERRKREEGTWVRAERLTPQDHAFRDRSGTFDAWEVDLIPGQTLRVVMRSTGMPPYFHVIGPMALDSPPIVAKAVRSSADVVRGEFSPAQPGEYWVVAYSTSDAYGAYELTSNYRLIDGLSLSSDNPEGLAAMLLLVAIVVWLVQYAGLPAYLSWRNPDRILLLRPFGQRRVSRALKRLNRRTLAYRGFTFTLADKHLKDSLAEYVLANVPTDVGSVFGVLYRPFFRRLHRRVLIHKPSDLALLSLRLRSRWRLTLLWQSWLGLSDRIMKFRSRDELWKDCAGMLLDDCQVIVVDLSHAGGGTAWELQELFRRGYGYKSVFLVQNTDDDERAARTLLAQIRSWGDPDEGVLPPLHRYATSNGRLIDSHAFDRDYAAAVSSSQQPHVAPLPVSWKAILALAPTAVLGPFWSPVGLPLGILALRDIRHSQGRLKGEMAAHFAVLVHFMIVLLFAGIYLLRG